MSFSNILKWLVILQSPYKPQFLLHCSIVSWLLVNQHLACGILSEYFSTYLPIYAEMQKSNIINALISEGKSLSVLKY